MQLAPSFILFVLVLLVACNPDNRSESLKGEDTTASPIFPSLEEETSRLNDEATGSVLTLAQLKHSDFSFFYLSIDQVLLIDSISDSTVTLTSPENRMAFNFSSLSPKTRLLGLHTQVPTGTYNRVVVYLSLKDTLAVAAHLPNMPIPLVDVAFDPIPDVRESFIVEAFLDGQNAITIQENSLNPIALTLDIDASTRFVSTESDHLAVLFSPQIQVKRTKQVGHFQVEGITTDLAPAHLSLTHAYKVKPEDPQNTLHYTLTGKKTATTLNTDRLNTLPETDTEHWGFGQGSLAIGKTGFKLSLSHLMLASREPEKHLFTGRIVEVTPTGILATGVRYGIDTHGLPFNEPVVNLPLTFQSSALKLTDPRIKNNGADVIPMTGQEVTLIYEEEGNRLTVQSLYLEPASLYAEVISTQEDIILAPWSYNYFSKSHENFSSLYPDTVKVTGLQFRPAPHQFLAIRGYQLKGKNPGFHALEETLIEDDERITLSISNPNVPVTSSLTRGDDDRLTFVLTPDLAKDSVLVVKKTGTNATVQPEKTITRITTPKNPEGLEFLALIESEKDSQSFNFEKPDKFHKFLVKKLRNEHYKVAGFIAEGTLDKNTLVAHEIAIAFYRKTGNETSDSQSGGSASRGIVSQITLAIFLPIIVPAIGAAIVGTVKRFTASIHNLVFGPSIRRALIAEVEALKMQRLNDVIQEINRNAEKRRHFTPLKEVSDLYTHEGLLNVEKLAVIKAQLQSNNHQLAFIFQGSPDLNNHIRLTNVLESYLDAMQKSPKINKVKLADEAYRRLKISSDNLNLAFVGFILDNQRKGQKLLIESVRKYTDDLHAIFVKTNTGILTEDQLKKVVSEEQRNTLEKEINRVRGTRIRF